MTEDRHQISYVALDVETANADWASICQVGIAVFGPDGVGRTWTSLVDPEDYFDGHNVSIHGITETDVRGAPSFPDVSSAIRELCDDQVVVHHMPFDRVAMQRASERYGLPAMRVKWLDSARVARRAWERFSVRGYGLRNLTSELSIPLQHHDALSDAIAAGTVLRRAMAETGLSVVEWLERAQGPISPEGRRGHPDGHLSGESIVFTGALTIPRRQAADMAADVGADVGGSVTRKTTIMVVGVQDLRRTGGRDKSSKHRKAEAFVEEGREISIIGEEDFLELVRSDGKELTPEQQRELFMRHGDKLKRVVPDDGGEP